jgi:cell fate regulator YaaT (PSP1 superfamily)
LRKISNGRQHTAQAWGKSPFASFDGNGILDARLFPRNGLTNSGAMSKYVVRYGAMRFLGVFSAHSSAIYCRDTRVIVRTDRGLEAGVVLWEATPPALAALKDPAEGQIFRTMTGDDELELLRIAEQARRELDICQKHVDQLGLEMNLVDLERLYGGERVVVYYLSENRVDFRELVHLLAGEFQTRIEMRQIGVRDEAKLLADFGDCGKQTCCNSHLTQMPPVSMRMAKMQKATLDPTKISGRCGRLKCCLRYEFEMYEQQELPLVQLDDGQLVRPAVPVAADDSEP